MGRPNTLVLREMKTAPPRSSSSNLLADRVYETLRGHIAQGHWAPGTQLRIREVAALVGTSVMPVREAFRRLEQAGLIVTEPYRGASVRELSIDELEYVYDVRIMLEPDAARRGAVLADDTAVETMRQHWRLLESAAAHGDIAGAVAQDELLLSALFSAGNNPVLTGLIQGMWDTCRPYKNLWVRDAVGHGLSRWSYLADLVAAVETRDGDGAFRILEHVCRTSRSTVRGILDPLST